MNLDFTSSESQEASTSKAPSSTRPIGKGKGKETPVDLPGSNSESLFTGFRELNNSFSNLAQHLIPKEELHPLLKKDAKKLAIKITSLRCKIENLEEKISSPSCGIKEVETLAPILYKAHPVEQVSNILGETAYSLAQAFKNKKLEERAALAEEFDNLTSEQSIKDRLKPFLNNWCSIYESCGDQELQNIYQSYQIHVKELVWETYMEFTSRKAAHEEKKRHKQDKFQNTSQMKNEKTPEEKLEDVQKEVKRITAQMEKLKVNSTNPPGVQSKKKSKKVNSNQQQKAKKRRNTEVKKSDANTGRNKSKRSQF